MVTHEYADRGEPGSWEAQQRETRRTGWLWPGPRGPKTSEPSLSVVQEIFKSLLQNHNSKASILLCWALKKSFMSNGT